MKLATGHNISFVDEIDPRWRQLHLGCRRQRTNFICFAFLLSETTFILTSTEKRISKRNLTQWGGDICKLTSLNSVSKVRLCVSYYSARRLKESLWASIKVISNDSNNRRVLCTVKVKKGKQFLITISGWFYYAWSNSAAGIVFSQCLKQVKY